MHNETTKERPLRIVRTNLTGIFSKNTRVSVMAEKESDAVVSVCNDYGETRNTKLHLNESFSCTVKGTDWHRGDITSLRELLDNATLLSINRDF